MHPGMAKKLVSLRSFFFFFPSCFDERFNSKFQYLCKFICKHYQLWMGLNMDFTKYLYSTSMYEP